MAHSKGDWMGQNLIECDYGAWRVQFKYPVNFGIMQKNCVCKQFFKINSKQTLSNE